jgi:hypothetical protein
MNHPRPFLTQIIAFLRSTCGLRDFKIDSQLFAVEFDALLIGADPLTIVAVECKTAVSERNLRHSIRKAQSFIWSAHTNNKLALLSLVVVVPDRLSPEAESLIENELSGTARVFVIAETMPIQEVEMRLSLLANPRLTRSDSENTIAGDLRAMLADCDAGVFEAMTKASSSSDDLVVKLLDELQTLVAEVDRAIDET